VNHVPISFTLSLDAPAVQDIISGPKQQLNYAFQLQEQNGICRVEAFTSETVSGGYFDLDTYRDYGASYRFTFNLPDGWISTVSVCTAAVN